MSVNPFATYYPENMTFKQIKDFYVDNFVDIENVVNHNHHIIWGSRGSGKSMLLKYIEAQCQASSIQELEKHAFTDRPVIPIYFKFANNAFQNPEFCIIDENYATLLSEHKMLMSIARVVISNIQRFNGIEKARIVKYVKHVIRECFGFGIENSVKWANEQCDIEGEPLEWIDCVCKRELDYLRDFLTSTYKKLETKYGGSITSYHDFLIPFLSLTKELFGLDDLVFFLLIDEAGKSYEFQQQILNGWIACRDHSLLSIKMTAIRVEYLTFYTPEKWSIQLTHDYLESSLEVVNYSKEDYKKNIKEIVLRRFKSFGISVDNVESFFPRDVDTIKLIDSEKEKLGFEYKSFGKGKKESFNDYCSRRLMPRVFQILSENKKAPDYSGFDVIVSVSSGIIRNFLVPAERMYDKVKSINGGKEILYIPADIQNEVLYNYSKEFYESIRSRSSFYNKEEYELLTGLENLIKSFGRFFRERLLMKSLSEGRVFSFSIKQSEKLNIRERRVFQLAEQNAYLQKSFVMLKNGAAVEEWYLLSRRLAPFFRLDPTALKGRLEISSKDIDLAMSDPDAFVMKKINSNVLPNQLSIFDDDLEFVNLEDGDHE